VASSATARSAVDFATAFVIGRVHSVDSSWGRLQL
jgi:hypothetical protein